MPKLGESVHEGTIEQWLVSVGDQVDEYEPLCEVITDKVTAEVPSTMAGTISEIIVKEGETVSINSIICKIDSQNENQPTSVKEKNNNNQNQLTKEITSKSESKPKNNGRFSPVVFRLASEHNIDLTQVHGTGFEGRVTKKDIQDAIDNPELVNHPTTNDEMIKNTNISSATTSEYTNKSSLVDISIAQQSSLPVKGVRKAIAQNMVTSVTETPHGWMMVEVDATNLVKTRNYHKASFKQNEGYNLTFFAFFVKAVAEALKAVSYTHLTLPTKRIV